MTIQGRNCIVFGGHGEFYVDFETGDILGSNLRNEEYGRIGRFDLAEFKTHYGLETCQLVGLKINISDIGFWEGAIYTAPEEFHRAEIQGELLNPTNIIEFKAAAQ